MSALSIAAAGLSATAARFERNAVNITRAGTTDPSIDLAAETADMLINQAQFEALTLVARRAAAMERSGIDILA